MPKSATIGLVLALLLVASCSKPTPKEYAYPAWGFAATFPDKPKTTETPGAADGSRPPSFLAHASQPGGYDFAVNVADASNATTTKDEMLDAAPQAMADSLQLDVGAITDAKLGTREGKQVRFDKGGKPVMLMRMFFAYQKFYEVSATIPKGLGDPVSLSFLNSFHLTSHFGGGGAPGGAAPANAAAAANAAS
ncbi:MAG: hypothetical protein JO127_06315 [Caulobacteraceae bacterium]|nr:hypothetical protein [Caulobacteraceae bacterium]